MSRESYARGFVKAAQAHGVDPVGLAKYAQKGPLKPGPWVKDVVLPPADRTGTDSILPWRNNKVLSEKSPARLLDYGTGKIHMSPNPATRAEAMGRYHPQIGSQAVSEFLADVQHGTGKSIFENQATADYIKYMKSLPEGSPERMAMERDMPRVRGDVAAEHNVSNTTTSPLGEHLQEQAAKGVKIQRKMPVKSKMPVKKPAGLARLARFLIRK